MARKLPSLAYTMVVCRTSLTRDAPDEKLAPVTESSLPCYMAVIRPIHFHWQTI